MRSLNKVQLIGNLGADPDVSVGGTGTDRCLFNLATTDRWKDKATGDPKSQTEWHRVLIFGKFAAAIAPHLRKGGLVYVEGSLKTRSYEKDGVKRYTTEVIASTVITLDKPAAAPIDTPGE